MSSDNVPFGPTGEAIYRRTYSRVKPNGERETWPETVDRVVTGNLSLVYGARDEWNADVQGEYDHLVALMRDFKIMPAGRHIWASGVKGRQYLMNCWTSGWPEQLSGHFEFTFLRLMEGGGVGANYSSRHIRGYGAPMRELNVHVVCDPAHPDYDAMWEAGVLSTEYDADWAGSFEVEDSREGWARALTDLVDTFMTHDEVLHANRVYDVSRVRSKGTRLKTFGGTASGPHPFASMMVNIASVLNWSAVMWQDVDEGAQKYLTPLEVMEIDHAIAECVVSGGNRRSARMSIVHWADPFIEDFLICKSHTSEHWTTNISVEVDDRFFAALRGVHGEDMQKDAEGVHCAVVEGMLANGEPGYWNSSLSNVGEPNPLYSTNPCAEICLEPFEPCNLGHVNLDAFAPTVKHGPVDWLALFEAHRLMTRFLVRATWGDVNDQRSRDVLARNRRIGVGHFGVQGFLAKQGHTYSLAPTVEFVRDNLRYMRNVVRREAREYAFQLRIPEPVKVTTVAPTGTIAKLPGVTEGIHPIYGRHFIRRVRFSLADHAQGEAVDQYIMEGFNVEECVYDKSRNTVVVSFPTKDKLVAEVEALGYPPEIVQSSDELTIDAMLAFQAMYQECYADNAVSYTVNIRPGMDAATVDATILRWLPVLKGVTVMVDGTRAQAPYERITETAYEAAHATVVADSTDEDCATGACPVR